MSVEDNFNAAIIGQVAIERAVKTVVKDNLTLPYYMIFAKQAANRAKRHKGQTLYDEIWILEEKWASRGLSGYLMDRIKQLINVPVPWDCFTLDISFLDQDDVLCTH